MKKFDFNEDWTVIKAGADPASEKKITLPYDAMIHEERRADAPGGISSAYFEGGKYFFRKKFEAPEEWKDMTVSVYFEGVYRNAVVSLNGRALASHRYGYTPFTVCLDGALKYGEENVLEVIADNSEQPNSRWYSGSGIYRPVSLLVTPKKAHIAFRGVKVTTLSLTPAKIRVETTAERTTNSDSEMPKNKEEIRESEIRDNGSGVKENATGAVTDGASAGKSVNNSGNVYQDIMGSRENETDSLKIKIEILDGDRVIASADGDNEIIDIPDAKYWSDEEPNLYTCRVTLYEGTEKLDEERVSFGIRNITWDARKGFMVNGKVTNLRGGCIHHDNGILGACEYDEAAERRVRIMKEAGFNAIRSAHNPCSEALLRACDKYGMYIMDESFDMWYMAKNKYDYHLDFEKCWKDDTRAMVMKDYNHPSVILYSIGNEVSEPCEEKGVETGREQVDFIHSLDRTRPVTCGTNLMIIGRAAKGVGIYSDSEHNDEEQKKATKAEGSQNASLMFNIAASIVGPGMNKAGNSAKVDRLVSPFCDLLDIAGYNYASGRYKMDGKLHPNRVIFGSETFPQDICRNWKMVEKYPYLIGDFMWAGWDYLGEVGIGAWSYTGGVPFARPYPWLLAGSGVIDINGVPDASCRYASTVWKKIDHPTIGVRPVNHPGVRPSKSVWRATNAIESWAWKGCEGNPATVEVYGYGDKAALFLGGRRVTPKKKLVDYKAIFHMKYRPETLTAVIYDENGNETARQSLRAAKGELHIDVKPERKTARPGELIYIDAAIADRQGTVESNADATLKIAVENGEILGFGNANPCSIERYDDDVSMTYYGRALAVVRAGNGGDVCIRVSGDGYDDARARIAIMQG